MGLWVGRVMMMERVKRVCAGICWREGRGIFLRVSCLIRDVSCMIEVPTY